MQLGVIADDFTGATDLQIMTGQGKTGAQIFQCRNGFQTFLRVCCQSFGWWC